MQREEIDRRREEHRRSRPIVAGLQDTASRRAYAQLRSSLRELPPTPELVETRLIADYGFSRNSIRRALQLLAGEGLLSRRPRLGTRVVGRVLNVPVLDVPVTVPAPRTSDEHLPGTGDPGASCGRAAVVREIDRRSVTLHGTRFAMTESLGSCGGPLYVRTVLRREAGPAGSRLGPSAVRAAPCDARHAALLGVREGTPVLVRRLVLLDEQDHPVEIGYTCFRGDRVALRRDVVEQRS